jgi:hypothetical protein
MTLGEPFPSGCEAGRPNRRRKAEAVVGARLPSGAKMAGNLQMEIAARREDRLHPRG